MMKKILKNLSFIAILSLPFATVQAQTPVVHLKLENNLNNDGSSSLIFETYNGTGLTLTTPFGTNSKEGNNALDFSAIDRDSDNLSWIQNNDDSGIISTTNLGISGSAARTVAAWVRYDNTNPDTNGAHTIVTLGDPNASATSNPQGRITFQLEGSNNRFQVAVAQGNVQSNYDPAVIEDGGWHHVAFTYPSGGTLADLAFYVDGSLAVDNDAGANSTRVLNTIDAVVYVGSDGKNGGKWFDGGGIDDLRIYDAALTAAEISEIYNGSTASTSDFAFGELKAYPTVVEDFLHIETVSNDTLQISVFDISGKVVKRTSATSLDMTSLTSGLYFVKVKQNNKVANLKVVKK